MNDVIGQWNRAAKRYSDFEGTSGYPRFCRQFVANHFKELRGARVLDAGCGNGAYIPILAQNGNVVTGCDGSEEMLRLAAEKHPGQPFDRVDLLEPLPYRDGEFDLVFCSLVLMDIDPIDGTLQEFHRILKADGRLFFSIVHPAFYLADWERTETGAVVARRVRGYITPTPRLQDIWGGTMLYHRPISFYYNKLSAIGFGLKGMYEPPVYESVKIPDIPLYLFSEFARCGG